MLDSVKFTTKQKDYIRNANHRWNIAEGAVRSGKSFLATTYIIPDRLLAGSGKKGLNFILGCSLGNIERNVLTPLRDNYGAQLVGEIRGMENTVKLFGEKVYCVGAEKKGQVAKLRGSEMKFCYCDEVADINEDVFELVKSRLSLPYSEFHGACNPSTPNHWLKQFIDKEGIDLYLQHYRLDDNPNLPESYVRNLKVEYAGSVFYKRYIDGEWAVAEGLVYQSFANGELVYEGLPENKSLYYLAIDYGISNPFVALLITVIDGVAYIVDEYAWDGRAQGQLTDQQHLENLLGFIGERYIDSCVIDPSATSFIQLLRQQAYFDVRGANNSVISGIATCQRAMGAGCLKINERCKTVLSELSLYSWDKSSVTDKVIKENDHAMDAMRYFVNTIGVRTLKCFQ